MAIYHKGQELSDPLHEGKKIKQIYHMGKMYLSEWLSPTTRAAIELAFGPEAGQVISSTNAYLDTIASTDTTRAQQLAEFIDEDPMLVCSLNLQPQGVQMPVRWLVGDGNLAWIDSGVIPTSNTVFEIKLYGRIYSGSRDFANSNMCLIYDYNSTYSFALGGKYIDSNIQIDANPHLFMITGNKVYFDDIKYEVPNASYPTVSQVFIFMFNEQNNNASGSSTGGITYARVGDAYLVPFTKRNGMLDLESMTIYPNKGTGTFTETYTLPDGTPWTPPKKKSVITQSVINTK